MKGDVAATQHSDSFVADKLQAARNRGSHQLARDRVISGLAANATAQD